MTAIGFQWTGRRQLAAILVAADQLTNQQIADRVGVSYSALAKWKANPEFAARVESIIESKRRAIMKRDLASGLKEVAAAMESIDRAFAERQRRVQRLVGARSRDLGSVAAANVRPRPNGDDR